MMRVFSTRSLGFIARLLGSMAAVVILSIQIFSQTQSAAADLKGQVTDANGAVVSGVTVTAKGVGNGIVRTAVTDSDGRYQIIGVQPGDYEVTAEATNFKKAVFSPVKLTVGQNAELAIKLEVGEPSVVVNVTGDDVPLVETAKTTVSNTIDQVRIQNLPINERSATGFALTISTVGRDNGRPVGPAPTSGLNIGGQRGRSTLVQVDGADFTDNSINAARSTVSQEAVQEYQVTTNSYMPEFGRATGGIINVVTKRGTNDFHGNVFGFLRDKRIQEKNFFAPIIDNDPNKKPAFTRTQYGATFGGPIHKNDIFFFGSYEGHSRQESGFFTGDIVQGATQSATIGSIVPLTPGGPVSINPISRTFSGLTQAQVDYINGLVTTGVGQLGSLATFNAGVAAICTARTYAFFASSGTQTALNGTNPLLSPNDGSVCPAISPILPGAVGQRFLLSGTPVPLTTDAAGNLIAFRPLAQAPRVFPISERTSFFSTRVDVAANANNQLNFRYGYNPSHISGIQDESQNQVLGQNDYSRTGIQTLHDLSASAAWTSIFGHGMINEFYYNFGQRKAKFESKVPSVGLQLAGVGFFGANPFSPVDRVEQRNQIRDNVTFARGGHTIKVGGDFNNIGGKARFDLNFPGIFNFSQQACSLLITGCTGPAFTTIQAYGLGFPSVFLQGFGDPNSKIHNRPVAFFAQDSWKIQRLTLNFGIRYDYEFTDQYGPTAFKDPLTGITLSASDVQTAQDALNVTQGFPRDKNNWAPRAGLALDVFGNGKTVIRGAAGMFFDHPLLAVAFNSNIADGSQQQQATLLPIGGPSPTGLFNAFQVFHGTVCGVVGSNPAICGAAVTPGVAASANYLYGQMRFNPSTFTGFGPILPFTLHVAKDFQYPEAFQANVGIEQMIGKNMAVSGSFILVNAKHLAHPQDVNIVRTDRLVGNFNRFFGFNPTSLSQAAFGISIPTSVAAGLTACPQSPNGCFTNAVGRTFAVIIPGMIVAPYVGPGGAPDLNNKVVNPIMANYFRTLGPNYFFIASASGGLVSKAIFDSQLGGSLATAGPINPYADVNAQLSNGSSLYKAFNIDIKKRFTSSFQFLASYTWSHSIDDSSDLQTLLKPQDNTNFGAERSDSLFDQRHRFVFSGVITSPDAWRSQGGFKKFMSDFTVSPIVEFGSGRPFNILAVGDANGDFQSTNERPTQRSDGTLCATGVDPSCQTGIFPANGNLPRNAGITHNYFSIDARVSRRIRLTDRVGLDIIAEGFNLTNRFNEAAANPFYQVVNTFNQRKGNKYYSQPTAAFDPRQFQLGVKLSF
ncbi:MAG: carboxypeptidase regulatory-like domain-containing protein [Acidobacteria bacterium]|nr:carboxypeptidase regulatory-like domain-containing protein [Acidobacteriota bacterium]